MPGEVFVPLFIRAVSAPHSFTCSTCGMGRKVLPTVDTLLELGGAWGPNKQALSKSQWLHHHDKNKAQQASTRLRKAKQTSTRFVQQLQASNQARLSEGKQGQARASKGKQG